MTYNWRNSITQLIVLHRWLLSVKFKYKLGYNPWDLLWLRFLSLVEITAFRLERIFQPMRALEFITGHMVYYPAYTQILQTKETIHPKSVWIIKCIFKCKVNIVQTHQGCKFYTWMWFGWNFPHYFLPFYPQNGTAISSRQECESGRGKREQREESIQYLNFILQTKYQFECTRLAQQLQHSTLFKN